MKGKFSSALSLALIVSMLFTSIAFADNVQNDIVAASESITLQAGVSSSYVDVQFYVQPTGGDGDAQCNFDSDSEKLTFTINTPSGVTANPTSLTFNKCHEGSNFNYQSVRFSANASAVSGSVSFTQTYNNSGGSFDYTQADFYINVTPSDSTPPVITPNVNGTLGLNGWYTSDVTVSWSVVDNESTITSMSGCDTTIIDADTAGTALTCEATSAGGSAGPVTVTIKRDATAPVVTVTPDRDPDQNGWYNAPVTFDTVGTDATSDVSDANCAVDQSYTGPDGTGLTVNGSCTDNAGNVGNGTSTAFDFDDTNPTLTWNGGPADGGNYYFGFVPAAPTCEASDALSGPNGCSVSGYGDGIGSHTLTATAYDVAGNSYSEQRTYTVEAWKLDGFYQPVDMGSVFNTVKGGSTVPLKFEIFAGVELTDTASIQSLQAYQVACTASGSEDPIETVTTGGTSLRYDWTSGQFIFNWQTPKKPGNCYKVTMTTLDGSSLSAFFKLK
jgi:hypothetical protein